jgi:hypothetical protein
LGIGQIGLGHGIYYVPIDLMIYRLDGVLYGIANGPVAR